MWIAYFITISAISYESTGFLFLYRLKKTLEKTKGAITNGQYSETGNIGQTRHRTKTNKTQNRKLDMSNTDPTKKPKHMKIISAICMTYLTRLICFLCDRYTYQFYTLRRMQSECIRHWKNMNGTVDNQQAFKQNGQCLSVKIFAFAYITLQYKYKVHHQRLVFSCFVLKLVQIYFMYLYCLLNDF